MIRKAALTDVKAIFAIEKESFPTPWSRWTFLAELTQPISYFLVVGPAPPEPWKVWGYIVYWVAAEEMHLLNLAVRPDLRLPGYRPDFAQPCPGTLPQPGGHRGLAGGAALQHRGPEPV